MFRDHLIMVVAWLNYCTFLYLSIHISILAMIYNVFRCNKYDIDITAISVPFQLHYFMSPRCCSKLIVNTLITRVMCSLLIELKMMAGAVGSDFVFDH